QSLFCSYSCHHYENTQGADGGISQDAFQVIRTESFYCPNYHCDSSKNQQQKVPKFHAVKNWLKPENKINPSFHHGSRMQVGAYWCGRFHSIGKPEMKRELCRFGKRPQQ